MKDKYVVFIVMMLSLFLIEREGRCDDVKDIPPGEDKITALREGEKAPYTGQLFDPSTALRWANWLQQYKLRLITDVELQRRLCEADLRLTERRLEIEKEKNTVVLQDYKRQIGTRDTRILELEKEVTSPPFYRTFWFGTTVGVLITGAMFGLGAWAVSSVK